MELCLKFDDSDFELKNKVSSTIDVPYNAKMCTPFWFEDEDTALVDDGLQYSRLRYSADYHYHQKNYEVALSKYLQLSEFISKSNLAVWLDVQESMCRSYSKLCRHCESFQLASTLAKQMREHDVSRQRQSLLLLASVCKAAQLWMCCIPPLEEVLFRLPHYAALWLELGRAYHHNNSVSGDAGINSSHVATCFAQAKMLLESSLRMSGAAICDRKRNLLKKVEVEMAATGIPQLLFIQAQQAMQARMRKGNAGEDDVKIHSTSDVPYNPDTFRERWFSWLNATDEDDGEAAV